MGFLRRLLQKKVDSPPRCTVVVPAAGSASRMEGQDKILLPLGEFPVLVHTLRSLEGSAYIQDIIVVTRSDLVVPVGQLCKDFAFSKVSKIIVGGNTRTASVLAGVREVAKGVELIAVHDGARPLVPSEVVNEVILRAGECGAAAPAVPVKDTVKRAVGGIVEATLDRETLFSVQTPQVFQAELILGALQKAMDDGVLLTDDCAAVERLGIPVALTKGSYENIKITTPTDLLVAEAILQGRDVL